MNLVAAVIEKASGRSYRDFVHDEILAPAGLKRSLLWEEVNPRKTQNLAVPAAGAADWSGRGPQLGPHGRRWLLFERARAHTLDARSRRRTNPKARERQGPPEPRFDSQDGDFTNLGWFTRVEPRHPRLLWIRGTEQNGFHAALYWYPDADLILAITTNLGPFESGRVTVSRALANRLEQALLPPERRTPQAALSTRTAFVPPKPNELDSASWSGRDSGRTTGG